MKMQYLTAISHSRTQFNEGVSETVVVLLSRALTFWWLKRLRTGDGAIAQVAAVLMVEGKATKSHTTILQYSVS